MDQDLETPAWTFDYAKIYEVYDVNALFHDTIEVPGIPENWWQLPPMVTK
jgi:hypothetical protein